MNKSKDFARKKTTYSAALILEDGKIFWGQSLGLDKTVIAELCFNTSMTGYQEILTDPSYAKQIITFTFPHIGIVGTNDNDKESSKPFAYGCVLSQEINNPSNWRSKQKLSNWLIKYNIPCITNVDTRQLTKILSNKGALKAALINYKKGKINISKIKKLVNKWNGLDNMDLASVVSTKKPYKSMLGKWDDENNKYLILKNRNNLPKIVCIDYGTKRNISRSLVSRNLDITILPALTSYEDIISHHPNGIFLSNGPGDPKATGKYAVNIIKKLIFSKIPIFGICLGHQIICLALGAKTKKMYLGHRGANHPVKNLFTNKVEITTQNHGFEVIRNTLPKEVVETHVSLFDNTNEGIKHLKLPVFSVQYHPEASPGPNDSQYLFDQFYKNVQKYAQKKRH